MKHIILCADDYGQNNSISQAIIDLLKKNRLSATSCMTNSAEWITHAKWLKPYTSSIDVGLHFNLTEGQPLTTGFNYKFETLKSLISKAYFRRLDKLVIKEELNAQLDRFREGMGHFPDFIDGHQHIHQLPIIRDVLLEVYEERLRKSRSYVRSVNNLNLLRYIKTKGYFKMMIIQLLGSSSLKKALVNRGIPFTETFSGIYDFSNVKDYSTVFPQFLKQIKNRGLIMCHPGKEGDKRGDNIVDSRNAEYHYFLSDQFVDLCAAHNISLGRFGCG